MGTFLESQKTNSGVRMYTIYVDTLPKIPHNVFIGLHQRSFTVVASLFIGAHGN